MEFGFLNPERSTTSQASARLASLILHALVVAVLLAVPWITMEPVERAPVPKVTLAAPPRPYRLPVIQRRRLTLPGPQQTAALAPAPMLAPATPKLRLLEAEPVITPTVAVAVPEVKITAPKPAEATPKMPLVVTTGTFETAASPEPAPGRRTVSVSGFGDAGAATGRARAAVAATTGFGDAAASAATRTVRTVVSGGFETAKAEAPRVTRAVVEDAGFAPVEILEKPQPVYTDEARRLRVEGSVQVRVVFGATGDIRVVGVVRSLGHGLDEAATAAALKIRFRPARRGGQAVDSAAVVQIIFQLA